MTTFGDILEQFNLDFELSEGLRNFVLDSEEDFLFDFDFEFVSYKYNSEYDMYIFKTREQEIENIGLLCYKITFTPNHPSEAIWVGMASDIFFAATGYDYEGYFYGDT